MILTERLGAETVVSLAAPDGGRLIATLGEDALFERGSHVRRRLRP